MIKSLLRRFLPTRRLIIERRAASSLRLEDWQASEQLVAQASQWITSPFTRLVLDLLRNESPVNYGLPLTGTRSEDRIVHQARAEGYHLCLNNIEALATLKLAEREVEATYETPESERT